MMAMFFLPIMAGRINIVPGNMLATAEFLYALLVLASAFLALFFSPAVYRGDGEAGLELCNHHEGPPDLIVTDVIMPRMGGIEFAEKVRKLWPGVRVLFISGYSDEAVRGSLLSEPFTSGVGQLQKPFRPTDLAQRVRELLDAD